ncbi:MAG: hypothetical protein NVS1B7_6630 [Candidatus Saccharimonadales bacterium]
MTTFEKEYANLNDQQRLAVDSINGPLLVIAGPGTGKTQLVSMRVANILKRTDVHANNILCLTFTESGQTAISSRLISLIGEDAKDVSIYTFHGFGTSIINANAQYFFDGEVPRAVDDLTMFEVLRSIFETLPHNSPLRTQFGEEFVFLKDVQTRISHLKSSAVTPEQLRQRIHADESWCQEATPIIRQVFQGISRLHKKYLPLLHDLSIQLSTTTPDTEKDPTLPSLSHVCIDELRAALTKANETGLLESISRWKSRWFERSHDGLTFKAVQQFKRLQAVANVYEQYTSSLRTQRLFDYDDMILDVITAISDYPELRSSLQEQFQYILVDEYQDTNGAQSRLLELLADNPVNEDSPNMMVVGDDDQAIYGFQGAEANVLLRFRERWRNVQTIVLTENYRSTQPILNSARQLIVQGHERLENYYDDISKVLRSQNVTSQQLPQLLTFNQEYEQNTWLIKKLKAFREQGIPLDQIAIVAPRHKYLHRLIPLLNDAGIEYQYERRANVLADDSIKQVFLLLQLIVKIAQQQFAEAQAMLPEILTAEWWAIPPQILWQLGLNNDQDEQDGWFATMTEGDDENLLQTVAWLSDVATMSLEVPVEVIVDKVLHRLQPYIDDTYVRQAFDAVVLGLNKYRLEQPSTLADLVHYISLCTQAKIAIQIQITDSTQHDAVHLMTAHRTKGLEFTTVIIINTTEHIWLAERGAQNKISLPPNIHIQPAGETKNDRLRLLYVAATRARQQLLFCTFLHDDNNKKHTVLSWLQAESFYETVTDTKQSTTIVPKRPTIEARAHWRTIHLGHLEQSKLRHILEPSLENYKLSPTHLVSFLDVTRGGPSRFLTRYLLRFPEPGSAHLVYGNAIHNALEFAQSLIKSTQSIMDVNAVVKHFTDNLNASNLTDTDRLRLIERGTWALSSYLAQRQETFSPSNLAEQNFRSEIIMLGGARLTGKIDRLRLNQETLTAVITDFKTGRSFNTWRVPTEYDKHKLHKFRQQLQFYKILVEGSSQFSHFTAINGIVEFIEPDKWDAINYLSYDYDQVDQLRLERLITAVWKKITTLQLPDTRHYANNFSGVLAFENDLIEENI